MLKHLRAFRRRLDERRQYEQLVAELERINVAEVGDIELTAGQRRGGEARGRPRRDSRP